MCFEEIFNESEILLTEGAIVERLKSEFNAKLDQYINHAGLIYSNLGYLEKIYEQYINIGKKHDLPIMLMTPTRKVNIDSISKSPYYSKNIISDSCKFLNKLKKVDKDYSKNILMGGLLGCKGDAYSSKESLSKEESYHFHRHQTTLFRKEKIDFLFAGIMPEIYEAIGMAKAMAETGIPYIISFMVRKDGCLIDSTPISSAINIIDMEVSPKPVCYMANCIHPSNLKIALKNPKNLDNPHIDRFKGIQANASSLSPEDLNNSTALKQEDFSVMVDEMLLLYKEFNLKIFGGCCGTNDVFLDLLSKRLVCSSSSNLFL